MHTKKLLTVFALGLGLTLALLWSLEATLAVAAPEANLTVTKFTDSADGTCDGDCSLREAIIVANGNGQANTIELGSGTFILSLTSGSGDPERDDLDVTSNYALTITGNGPQNTFINADGIDRVLYIDDGVPTVVISGVTIYGGASASAGGGIDSRGGDLTLINVAVVSNTAASGGGGVALTGSDATLTLDGDCLVADNETGYSGGGISVSGDARALLRGGRIVSNTAVHGGGVYVEQSNVTLSGVQIVSNTASARGGGVYLYGAGTLSGGAILSNTANNSGGGLFVDGAFTQTGQSIIAYNTADERGGGIHLTRGTAILNDGQIVHNKVTSVVTINNSYGGGGIYVGASGATLIQTGNHTIAENNAARHGGGMHVEWGKVTLGGGQILSNTAGENGGGIYLYYAAAVTQTGGLIAYNEAQGTNTNDGGGGLYSSAPSNLVSLNGGQIMENQAHRGGGLCIPTGNFDLLGAEIVDNHATQYGGGVYAGLLGYSTLITGGRIISNSAEYGGGLYAAKGNVTLERGQIVGNQANAQGGGVYHDTDGTNYHMLTLVNTTISGNGAPNGSALFNASGTMLLTYTTVASNTAAPTGYGITGTGSIRAKNTIIAYNSPWNCDSGAITSQGNNIADDFTCGLGPSGDQQGVDPELANLAEDRGTLVHAIAASSPPHGAGDCLSGILTDQRGVHRLDPCDVGAYEYGTIYTLTVTTAGTGTGTLDPSVGTHFYLDGAAVSITATASSNSTFDGWSGAGCGGVGDCVVTMDTDKQVTATFTAIDFAIYLPLVIRNQ
ncbi:MAG: CSLREA domain-containing protein [Chloroflexi bacterium]|nr:CSLREA domain-containing protein [Chloroflexota bacterium]